MSMVSAAMNALPTEQMFLKDIKHYLTVLWSAKQCPCHASCSNAMLGSSASKIFHPYRTCHNKFLYYIQQNYFKNVKYDILREVTMKITVFWEAASCSLLFCKYTNVQWNVLLHLQGKGSYQVTCHNSVMLYNPYIIQKLAVLRFHPVLACCVI